VYYTQRNTIGNFDNTQLSMLNNIKFFTKKIFCLFYKVNVGDNNIVLLTRTWCIVNYNISKINRYFIDSTICKVDNLVPLILQKYYQCDKIIYKSTAWEEQD